MDQRPRAISARSGGFRRETDAGFGLPRGADTHAGEDCQRQREQGRETVREADQSARGTGGLHAAMLGPPLRRPMPEKPSVLAGPTRGASPFLRAAGITLACP